MPVVTDAATFALYRLSFLVSGLFVGKATVADSIYLAVRNWQEVRTKLDDGNLLGARSNPTTVLVNFLRFGRAVVKVPVVENKSSDVEGRIWPHDPLKPEDGTR